jgi:aspartate aminotransferase
MNHLSKRASKLTGSATAKAAEKANSIDDVIRLDVGEPDFDTPLHIKASGMEAIQSGATKYTPMRGSQATLAAIQQKIEKENQLTYETSQLCVNSGAKQTIYNLFMAILDPKDEVIIPAPYWTSYPEMVTLAGGKPRILPTTPEKKFKITADDLEQAITDKTKCILLNSPCNPSGAVYSRSELYAIGEVLEKHTHVVIALDEVYEKILFTGDGSTSLNLVNVKPSLKERSVLIYSLSKTYAMTGWRLGYAAGPEEIIGAMVKLQSQMTGCVSSLSQRACIDALSKQSITSVQEMLAKYHSRLELCIKRLEPIPLISFIPPQGGFYILINIEALAKAIGCQHDTELCDRLLTDAHVSFVPGSAFGIQGHMRMSFATNKTKLNEAFDRLEAFVESATKASLTDS